MADDPLAKHRLPLTPVIASAPQLPQVSNDYEYEPFAGSDRQEYIAFIRKNGMVREPSYGGLIEISHDGEAGSIVILTFSFNMQVTIQGRNLHALVTGIRMKKIEFVQEFDAERWEAPKDSSLPFVESIAITVMKPAKALATAEQE
jgi:hypothetical protein